jgi:hypothetical protein
MKVRKGHEARIEALLTQSQRKAWKELLGGPFDFGD